MTENFLLENYPLTRRGRLFRAGVFAVSLTLSSLGIDKAIQIGQGLAGDVARASADTPDILKQPHKIVIAGTEVGTTEWEIAQQAVGPQGDPRPVVDLIEKALGTTDINYGEAIPVPENSRVGVPVPPEKSSSVR